MRSFLNLVIKSTCVFNFFLIRQWFGHIVVPTLRTAKGKMRTNHNIILKPPYHMVGQVGEGCLFITSPVRTSYLRVPFNIRNSKIRVKTVLKL